MKSQEIPLTTEAKKPLDEILHPQLQQRVRTHTDNLIADAARHYRIHLKPLAVRFDIKGSAWGYYVRKHRIAEIRYNPWLFARNFSEGLADTVPHEVAHYVVDTRFRRRRKPHGPEWREVMQFFGIDNPRATAIYSLEGLPVRRQRRHTYVCNCQTHEISTTRHHRIMRGMKYSCRQCGSYLQQQ